MPRIAADIRAVSGASFLTVTPVTELGAAWLEENTFPPQPGPSWHVEHRYGPDLLLGAYLEGLEIELDGRLADAPREAFH